MWPFFRMQIHALCIVDHDEMVAVIRGNAFVGHIRVTPPAVFMRGL